ncbi:MAG: hypothetical protein LIO53_04725 [Oscillospiraceae bacterium]|nr:hypothetical protein [Oscillospiraceae bacterium]
MKKRLQTFTAGIVVGVLCAGGAVYAKSKTETIEVTYDNIKVYKDNVLCELKDANGSTIEPFIYNGTTYMPVRGVASAVGMNVTWDGTNKGVYLWDEQTSGSTYLMEVCPPYETSSFSDNSFYMGGEKYSNGFFTWFWDYGCALFNLNGKYSELECYVGHVDGSGNCVMTASFYVDGSLVYEIDVEPDELPQKVSVPLNYGLQLKIKTNVNCQDGKIGIGNITVQ